MCHGVFCGGYPRVSDQSINVVFIFGLLETSPLIIDSLIIDSTATLVVNIQDKD
jgi:hypothetical protein